MNGTDILAIAMQKNDADAATIGEYLRKLLTKLWREGEGFSGKRPFGNSGWEGELYQALVAAKAVKGSIDEDGYLQTCDERAANGLIFDAINSLR